MSNLTDHSESAAALIPGPGLRGIFYADNADVMPKRDRMILCILQFCNIERNTLTHSHTHEQ